VISADIEALVQRPFIKSLMERVIAFQEEEFGGNAAIDWKVGTYYTGVFAAHLATNDAAFRNAAHAWGEKAGWKIGSRPFYADDICMGQTMLDLYLSERNPAYIEDLRRLLEAYVEKSTLTADEVHCHRSLLDDGKMSGRNLWWWCDALYMAPPVLARMYAATGEQRYLDLLHKLYWDTVQHLFDTRASLFYRDLSFFPKDPVNAPDREKVFWSRGNGWVYAGLVRVIDYLPRGDPQRDRYLALYTALTRKLVTLQFPDGLWRAWLNRTDLEQTPEVSGTSFFAYGLLAGVNRGWLDRKSYLPSALRAWRGLVSKLGINGKLGFAQIVDSAPNPVRPESSIDYTHGAFLLAASELYTLNLSTSDLLALEPAHQPRLMLADAAWSGRQDKRAVVADQHVYLGGVAETGQTKFYAYRLNPPNAPAILREATDLSSCAGCDDRNAPIFLRFDDTLLAVYSSDMKTGGWHWRTAPIPRQLPGWGPLEILWSEEHTFKVPAAGARVIHVGRLSAEDRRIYVIYRSADSGLYLTWSADGAKAWQPGLQLVHGAGELQPDVHVADNGRDRMDFMSVDTLSTEASTVCLFHFYYQAGAFHTSDGKVLRRLDELSERPLSGADGVPLRAGCPDASICDLKYDGDGKLLVALCASTVVGAGVDLRYTLATWDAESATWHTSQIACAGTSLTVDQPCEAGGIALHPERGHVVFISSNVDPATGMANATGRYQLFRGTANEQGGALTWEQLTFDASHDNIRPFVPRGQGTRTGVMWLRGTYHSHCDYRMDVYALGI
jgi:rhamnogalacturonyl hydrolase YesR